MQKDNNEIIFDEKLVNIFKKIDIPTNPLSFYFNIWRIEKDLSEWVRDYFYKAINEFISPIVEKESLDTTNIIKNNKFPSFLMKLYYYSGFMESIAENLNILFEDIKYYDIWMYIQCAVYFDSNIKLKIISIIENKIDILDEIEQISSANERKKLIEKYKFLQKRQKESARFLMQDFEKKFYSIKDKNTIEKIYKHLYVDTTKYPISYNNAHMSFSEYENSKYYWYYNAVSICFSHIVEAYDRKHKNIWNILEKIQASYDQIRKTNFIRKILKENDKFKAWKKLHEESKKYFQTENEFKKYLTTYLINSKYESFKKMFYWEAINKQLSENEFAQIWWANLFYLQKIDEKIADFNLLLFFKQFKDTLIWLYNSIFWPFIKPYFYYILVFKSIKLPLKDWQKFFFLLMFFSAESYEEYIILQNISKSIERIWLWNYNAEKSKIIFFIKRAWKLFKEFYSSIILLLALVLFLWIFGLINIIMLAIILLLMSISLLKYLFFPWRFEILRSFWIIMFSILWYVWFTTIFPQITKPQYIHYVGKELESLVSLDFSGAKNTYNKMISFVYWKDYKQNEKKLMSSILDGTKKWYKKIKESDSIKQIVKSSKQVAVSILDTYIKVKPWKYLKYYVNQELSKYNLPSKSKNEIANKVVKKYVNWYCKNNKNYYCKTKLENIPVWFKINLTKIKEFIEESL